MYPCSVVCSCCSLSASSCTHCITENGNSTLAEPVAACSNGSALFALCRCHCHCLCCGASAVVRGGKGGALSREVRCCSACACRRQGCTKRTAGMQPSGDRPASAGGWIRGKAQAVEAQATAEERGEEDTSIYVQVGTAPARIPRPSQGAHPKRTAEFGFLFMCSNFHATPIPQFRKHSFLTKQTASPRLLSPDSTVRTTRTLDCLWRFPPPALRDCLVRSAPPIHSLSVVPPFVPTAID
jgi:hypothetical protein